jgi:hypothetical protein
VDVPDIPVEPAGGSRYPSGMEARVAVLEQLARMTAASLERIEQRLDTGLTQADDRMRLMDERMRLTDERLERMAQRLDTGLTHADDRMDRIEQQLNTRLTRTDSRINMGLTHTDSRMDQTDNRLDRIDRQLDMLWGEQHSDFRWLLGMMIAGTGTTLAAFLGLLGVMAHGFHWL